MKPRLLDLFCGAGGAAMGYHRAGFEVVGVDIKPQPRYPFGFVRSDAAVYMANLLEEQYGTGIQRFDAIHASPPCQRYAGVTKWRGRAEDHPDLVAETRDLLEQTGLPWIIENVREAPVRADYLICGTMLGLPVRRHRVFETNWSGAQLRYQCQHSSSDLPFMHKGERAYADAMGCTWMSNREARQAIPPAYAEHIGSHLLAHVQKAAA